jgi:hypothetical protein
LGLGDASFRDRRSTLKRTGGIRSVRARIRRCGSRAPASLLIERIVVAQKMHDGICHHLLRRQEEQVPVVDELQTAVRNEPMHELRIDHMDQRVTRARENERRLP